MNTYFSKNEVNQAFEVLADALKTYRLPTSTGKYRTPTDQDAGEFMLMHRDHHGYWFKHRDTRNYLLAWTDRERGTSKLFIPITDRPFMRGEYDKFEVPA